MAQNVNRKMKKIWKEKLGRGGAPAHGSKSELVGLVVLVLSLLLLLVLSILAIGLVLTILAAGLHLVRILILHQAHLAFADCSVPGKNKIIRKFFSQMGIPQAALLCYNEPVSYTHLDVYKRQAHGAAGVGVKKAHRHLISERGKHFTELAEPGLMPGEADGVGEQNGIIPPQHPLSPQAAAQGLKGLHNGPLVPQTRFDLRPVGGRCV